MATSFVSKARWERGVFLGVKVESTEKIVGTDNGVFVVQSVRRLPEDQRYDSEALSKLKGIVLKDNEPVEHSFMKDICCTLPRQLRVVSARVLCSQRTQICPGRPSCRPGHEAGHQPP